MLVQPALFQKCQFVLDAPESQQAQSETGDADTEQEEQRQLPAFQQRELHDTGPIRKEFATSTPIVGCRRLERGARSETRGPPYSNPYFSISRLRRGRETRRISAARAL